jgi:hypothetical protein
VNDPRSPIKKDLPFLEDHLPNSPRLWVSLAAIAIGTVLLIILIALVVVTV